MRRLNAYTRQNPVLWLHWSQDRRARKRKDCPGIYLLSNIPCKAVRVRHRGGALDQEQREWMKALDTVSAGVGAKQVIDKSADLRLRNVKLIFNDERYFSADNVENLGKCWNLGI